MAILNQIYQLWKSNLSCMVVFIQNYETTIRNVDTFVKLKDKSVISQGGEVIVPASGETAEDISRASVVKNQGVIIGGDLNVIKVNIYWIQHF